jgi:hypothetical protein
MHESSNYSYISIKYIPLIVGLLFLLMAIWVIIDPTYYEITVNGVKRDAVRSDSLMPLIFGILALFVYLTVGRKTVKMKINNNEFVFNFKGKENVESWGDVEKIKKYWFVAPPLYSVKFENGNTFFFTTKYFCIVIPFYVYDISEMGSFIKKRKMEIPFLKELKKEPHLNQ